MHLLADSCCNPLRLEDGCHDIKVDLITDSLRELFWRYLYGETHTCLLCRLKMLQELWITEPERCDPDITHILREAEQTIFRMENALDKMKKSNEEADFPMR